MKGHAKDLQDANICMAISGVDDISNPGVQIVEDYFLREQEENRREQGLRNLVKVQAGDETLMMAFDPDSGRSEKEIQMWKNDRYLSELEAERTNRPTMEYPHDEFDGPISLPKSVTYSRI